MTKSCARSWSYFNDDDLDPVTAEDPVFYKLILTNETVENTDDEVFLPETVAYDPVADLAVLTFAQPLHELAGGAGTFRLRIGTDEEQPLPPLDTVVADDPGSSFGTAVSVGTNLSVVGDGSAFANGQTFDITNDQGDTTTFAFMMTPMGVDPVPVPFALGSSAGDIVNNLVTAINAADIGVTAEVGGGDRIALTGAKNVTLGAGLVGLETGTLESLIIRQEIVPTDIVRQVYDLDLPGSNDEPGHRDIPSAPNRHVGDAAADTDAGISTFRYNFQSFYGFDPRGNPLFNDITDTQKQRAREVFEILGQRAGVQFVETDADGFNVVTGDMRALAPGIDVGPGGTQSLSGFNNDIGQPQLILDNGEVWDDSFNGTWFQRAMHEVGHLLGLLSSFDLPPGTLMGEDTDLTFDNPIEPDFPGDHDIVHLQHLFRPESKDIDLYRFELSETRSVHGGDDCRTPAGLQQSRRTAGYVDFRLSGSSWTRTASRCWTTTAMKFGG